MSLETLELLPRGETGWGSGKLTFGRIATLLLGPNGAGKTPILKALSFCLGHPVELPPLVVAQCRAVRLTIAVGGEVHTIQRQFEAGVNAIVTDPFGETKPLRDERALSEWVLPKLGVSLRILSGKAGEKISPYLSVVGPMFLVDQDTGWASSYIPSRTHQFVKDQEEEVVRWLLDVPARHRPTDKKAFEAAKTHHASIQEQIAFKRRALESLQRELGEDRAGGASQRLEERRLSLESTFSRAHSVLEGMSQAESVLDARVREAVEYRDRIAYKLANIKRRKMHLVEVQAEVGAELEALEQNEIAAEVFRKLCSNEACQFFRKPDNSYGRRILYLKDQLKDFESSTGETERELHIVGQQLATAEIAVQETVAEKVKSMDGEGGTAALKLVQATSSELGDIRVRIDRLERITRERQKFESLLEQEFRSAEEVAEIRPTGGLRRGGTRLLDARQRLAETFKGWLQTLRTQNISGEIVFDKRLRLVIDGVPFSSKSSYSGSTRTRIVLAYHAAIVETSLSMNGEHPRLLVLDAPRQQELSAEDLRAYIKRFHTMSGKLLDPVQLVFSTKDPEAVPADCVDALWKPLFDFEGEPRFLGAVHESLLTSGG